MAESYGQFRNLSNVKTAICLFDPCPVAIQSNALNSKSKVGNRKLAGTIPAQTTIWYAALINQVGREKAHEAQKTKLNLVLSCAIGLGKHCEANH